MRVGGIRNTILAGIVVLSSACSHIVPKDAKWATKIAETPTKDVFEITKKAACDIYQDLHLSSLPVDTQNVSKVILEEPKKQGSSKSFIMKFINKPEYFNTADGEGTLKRTEILCTTDNFPYMNHFKIDSTSTISPWENKLTVQRYAPGWPRGYCGAQKQVVTPTEFGLDMQKMADNSKGKIEISKRVNPQSDTTYVHMDNGKSISKKEYEMDLNSRFSVPEY